jgi:hypothetical protein
VGLQELDDATAPGVQQAIDRALETVGLDVEAQKKKVISNNLDGASVNMGGAQRSEGTIEGEDWPPYQ